MLQHSVEFEIVINGKIAPEYKDESGDTYIEGRDGSNYSLRIRNKNYHEVLVVPSIDGLSVIDGKPATMDSGGYILRAYETVEIPGWKLDNNSVANFIFGNSSKSYASETGQNVNNIGVIGLAVYNKNMFRHQFIEIGNLIMEFGKIFLLGVHLDQFLMGR